MNRLLAQAWIFSIIALDCVAIWIIAIWPVTWDLKIQLPIAGGAAILLLMRDGVTRGGRILLGLSQQIAWLLGVTVLLVYWEVLSPSAYVAPAVLFSSVLVFQLILSLISFRHIILATRPGPVRNFTAVLRGVLTTHAEEMQRVRFHLSLSRRSVSGAWPRLQHRLIGGTLAILLWTIREIPKRIETYKNRTTILGRQL